MSKKVSANPYLDSQWSPHARFDDFLSRVQKIVAADAIEWSGYAFRFSDPQHAMRLDGVGAKMYGGRWNPSGMAACYGATSPHLATAETYATATDGYGFDRDDLSPRVLFAFEAFGLRVIDLTDGRVRQRLRVSEAKMISTPWKHSRRTKREALTQAIGRAALLAGCQGLVVPTRHSRTQPNIVAFPQSRGTGSRIKTIDPEKLGRNP